MTKPRIEITRRAVLKGVGAVLGGAALRCGGPLTGEMVAGATARRQQAQLSMIKNVVVLMQENHSLDQYLGSRLLLEGDSIMGLTGTETNPAPDGTLVPVHRLEDFTPADPPHEWESAHQQWDGGRNDGFVIAAAGPDQDQVMGYYARDQLPVHYALADQFTTCDGYFCSLLGPTWPNRFYLHGGTSRGVKDATPIIGFDSIFDQLTAHGISNLNYFSDVPWAAAAYFKLEGLAHITQFFEQAVRGTLPRFSIIDPQFFGPGANDDHPDHDVRLGQALIASVYAAIASSPQWKDTLLLITYDEHGGFFDHVPPPAAADDDPEFRQLGFRVPTLAIGPYVGAGAVVSTVYDHTSILKTLARRYELPPLTTREANANDMVDVLDPDLFRAPRPPPSIAPLVFDRAELEAMTAARAARPDPAHAEIARAADTRIPRHLDRRSYDTLGSAADVLEWGRRLGVVRIR